MKAALANTGATLAAPYTFASWEEHHIMSYHMIYLLSGQPASGMVKYSLLCIFYCSLKASPPPLGAHIFLGFFVLTFKKVLFLSGLGGHLTFQILRICFMFFFKLCCPRSYNYVSITKNQLLPYK